MSLFFVIPLAFLVVFPVIWCGVVWLVGRFGWHTLAAAYATDAPATGETFRFQSGRVGASSYSGVLTVSIEPDGLRLDVMALYRPGHPPVLIPWDEVLDITPRKGLFGTAYALTPAAPDAVTVTLPERVIQSIRDRTAT